MQFILTGFTQDTGFRVFAFEGVAVGQIRTVFTVRADLALSRRYGIAMQELPLLCKRLVEAQADPTKPESKEDTLMFSERDMLGYASNRSAAELAAEVKKRARRMPSSNRVGMAWRTAPHR